MGRKKKEIKSMDDVNENLTDDTNEDLTDEENEVIILKESLLRDFVDYKPEIEQVADLRNALIMVEKSAEVRALEQQVADLSADLVVAQTELSKQTTLTDEQKSALKLALGWLADFRRNSRDVSFRKTSKEVASLLGKLL